MAFFSLTKLSDWLKGRQQGITRNYKKHLSRKLPVTDWLPNYNLNFAISDLIAGLTVGLTVIPQVSRPMRARDRVTWPPYSPLIGQGIAYAIVAGLPPQYGLYSAFMGCFVYCVFGSCKDITIGPTAIMALMTGEWSYFYRVERKLTDASIVILGRSPRDVRRQLRHPPRLPVRPHHPGVRPPQVNTRL